MLNDWIKKEMAVREDNQTSITYSQWRFQSGVYKQALVYVYV